MKILFVFSFIFLLVISFVSATLYEGDGIYFIEEGDTFIADNGWKLDFVSLGDPAPYHQVYYYNFEVVSPEGASYPFLAKIGNEEGKIRSYYVNATDTSSENVLNITFYNEYSGSAYKKIKKFEVLSLTDSEKKADVGLGVFKNNYLLYGIIFLLVLIVLFLLIRRK
jgi:hypothetical protein